MTPEEISVSSLKSFRIGNAQDMAGGSGCTVILCEKGAVAGVDVRGGAPASHETELLHPVNTVDRIHAVVLSGGSAFGLEAAAGVMRFLEEKGVGFPVGPITVPIVCGASLFDLAVGDGRCRPDKAMGYEACRAAYRETAAEGNFGAGTGATVGKWLGTERSMKSGLGIAAVRAGDLIVAAVAAVNAVGDVVDAETGTPLAGLLSADGSRRESSGDALLAGAPPLTRQHDTGMRSFQRGIDQSSGFQNGGDGSQRAGPHDSSGSHHNGRRHRILYDGRYGIRFGRSDRISGRLRDRKSHQPRRDLCRKQLRVKGVPRFSLLTAPFRRPVFHFTLAPVHIAVGLFHKGINRTGTERRSDSIGDSRLPETNPILFRNRFLNFIQKSVKLHFRLSPDNHQKLVSPVTADKEITIGKTLQHIGKPANQPVAGIMSEPVVHILQIIQIKQCSPDMMRKSVTQIGQITVTGISVVESGQTVAKRQ